MFKKLVVIVATALTFVALFANIAFAECSYFGCSPEQGNPIRELAGMIVAGAVVSALLYGAAKRFVK